MQKSTTVGDKATYTFTGRNVAVVMPLRSTLGSVKICLDGTTDCATVDLSPSTGLGAQKLVFSRNALDPAASHTVTVKVVSGRADLDAFVKLG